MDDRILNEVEDLSHIIGDEVINIFLEHLSGLDGIKPRVYSLYILAKLSASFVSVLGADKPDQLHDAITDFWFLFTEKLDVNRDELLKHILSKKEIDLKDYT